MLMNLHIENIAVIERADIAFDAGLNVLTGETGAGKSIVIDALHAVTGQRLSRELLRTGSDAAQVTAIFGDLSAPTVAALADCGVEPDEDGLLLIQRSLFADGKSASRVNGRPVTVSLLREIGSHLVAIHGQQDNQSLLAPEKHGRYLDRLGGHLPLLQEYREAFAALGAIRRRIEEIDLDEAYKARRLDLLQFQVEEIASAALKSGEEEELEAKCQLLRHAEKVDQSLRAAYGALDGGEDADGALVMLEKAAGALNQAAQYLEAAQPLAQNMQELVYELEECLAQLRGFSDGLLLDPREQDEIEARLDKIHRLKSKYGATVEEVLAFEQQAREELASIENADALLLELQQQQEKARIKAEALAARLSARRRETATRFAEEVVRQLQFLAMPGVQFFVDIQPTALSPDGADKVEFLLSANAGEEARPLARIASGGELSRIMLAIKSVLADADDIDTLIYDEIDTGISGHAAQKVGIKLWQTAAGGAARGRQILCVTHLAQIAAQGDSQFLIAKSVREGRTFTQVTRLDDEGRRQELARIMGGEVTTATLEAAGELLRRAHTPAQDPG